MLRILERLIRRYPPIAHVFAWSILLFGFAQLGRGAVEAAPSLEGVFTVSIGIAYLLVAAVAIALSVALGRERQEEPVQQKFVQREVMCCVLWSMVLLVLSALASWLVRY